MSLQGESRAQVGNPSCTSAKIELQAQSSAERSTPEAKSASRIPRTPVYACSRLTDGQVQEQRREQSALRVCRGHDAIHRKQSIPAAVSW